MVSIDAVTTGYQSTASHNRLFYKESRTINLHGSRRISVMLYRCSFLCVFQMQSWAPFSRRKQKIELTGAMTASCYRCWHNCMRYVHSIHPSLSSLGFPFPQLTFLQEMAICLLRWLSHHWSVWEFSSQVNCICPLVVRTELQECQVGHLASTLLDYVKTAWLSYHLVASSR